MYRPPVDATARFLNDMANRLDDCMRTINDLQRRVMTLEGKDVVVPQNPLQVKLEGSVLTFTVSNSKYIDFLDIRVNNEWFKFWSPDRVDMPEKFSLQDTLVTVILPPMPVRRLEICTRYDKFTKTSEAGRAVVSM